MSSIGDGVGVEIYGIWLNQRQLAVLIDVLEKCMGIMQRKDIGKPPDSGPTGTQVPMPETDPIPVIVDEGGAA